MPDLSTKNVFVTGANSLFAQSSDMGALPALYAATAPDVNGCDYIGPGGLMNMCGYPGKELSIEASYDEADACRLWSVSEDLTNVHVAPFASTISMTQVNLAVDGQVLPGALKYLESTDYIPLPAAGSYLFEVLAGGATAISDSVVVEAGVPLTIAAIGDNANQPLEYLVLTDDLTAPESGNGKVRIAHAAPFAANIDDTKVDICTQDGNLVAGLAGVPYGAETGFLTLPINTYDLKVTAAAVTPCSGDTIIDIPAFELQDGAIATVFAVGGANDQMPGAYSPELGRLGIPYLV